MLAAAAGSIVIGTYLWFAGAWPVIGFAGLDVLLLYLAFRINYAHARLSERVRLTADELGIERSWPGGRREIWRFEPHWTRVETLGDEEGILRLQLSCRGRSLVLGSFLSPVERTALASDLRAALARPSPS